MLGAPSPMMQKDLAEDLAAAAQAIAADSITVETVVTGSLVPINLRVLDALQHLGKEAIANAISHSGLTRLRLEVNYTSETVELKIVDDGRGFNCATKTTGFGIVGIQKRARDVGGRLTITSQDGVGTEVNVLVNVQRDTWTGRLFTVLRTQLRALVSS